ncbi:Protein YidD [Clostridiaceae bacterium JG1575]|nr:Protein YidD [Clostridiaceae bacterium JG1575]
MKKLLIRMIRWYQTQISPNTRPRCRFIPTCSQYSLEAIEIHGAWKGSWMALKRILRCHPFYKGPIYDPVEKD